MDAFYQLNALIHDLLPDIQQALDQALVRVSNDYWADVVLKNLSGDDASNWRRNGLCSIDKVDLQAAIKIIKANPRVFQEYSGAEFPKKVLDDVKKMRNAIAHSSGAIPIPVAKIHIEVMRRFVTWLKIPQERVRLIDTCLHRLESAAERKPYAIRVSPKVAASETVVTSRFVMSEYCAIRLSKMSKEDQGALKKRMAELCKDPGGFDLMKHDQRIFSATIKPGCSALLYNTPADEYIFIALESADKVEAWIQSNEVAYDSVSGIMTISNIVRTEEGKSTEVVWTTAQGNEAEEMPDRGGGAVEYNPDKEIKVPVGEMLKKNPSRKTGLCVLNDELYKRMLDGTLENWQLYLHPDQRTAVEMDSDGPMMVKGPAGTGKTVVVVHRVKWLLENKFTNDERILVTTFNKSLEFTIDEMLEKICTPEQKRRVVVKYFDQMLQEAWRELGGEKILYGDAVTADPKNLFRGLMKSLREEGQLPVNRDDDFLEREYDYIVHEHGIKQEAEYLHVVRPMKFGVLRQEERKELWRFFEKLNKVFDETNIASGIWTVSTRMRVINYVTKAILDKKLYNENPYASVLVDESQDMGSAEYRLFAAMTGNNREHENPNSLLFAGDGNQRIYGRMGSLISCGINVRGRRTIALKKCYRSSKAIKRYAESIVTGVTTVDMNDGKESFVGSEAIEEGFAPKESFVESGDYDGLYKLVATTIKGWMTKGSSQYSDYAFLLREGNYRTSKTWKLEKAAEALCELGLPAMVVSGRAHHRSLNRIKVMTMHRSKGMQFHGVVINLNGWPHKPEKTMDLKGREELLDEEKRLLYTAVMRALRFVLLTGTRKRPKELPALECNAPAKQVVATKHEKTSGKTNEDACSNSQKYGESVQDESPLKTAVPRSNAPDEVYCDFKKLLKASDANGFRELKDAEHGAGRLLSAEPAMVGALHTILKNQLVAQSGLAAKWKEFASNRNVKFDLLEAMCAYVKKSMKH